MSSWSGFATNGQLSSTSSTPSPSVSGPCASSRYSTTCWKVGPVDPVHVRNRRGARRRESDAIAGFVASQSRGSGRRTRPRPRGCAHRGPALREHAVAAVDARERRDRRARDRAAQILVHDAVPARDERGADRARCVVAAERHRAAHGAAERVEDGVGERPTSGPSARPPRRGRRRRCRRGRAGGRRRPSRR